MGRVGAAVTSSGSRAPHRLGHIEPASRDGKSLEGELEADDASVEQQISVSVQTGGARS